MVDRADDAKILLDIPLPINYIMVGQFALNKFMFVFIA